MAICPAQIRYLTKGKMIGAKSNAGFVDTFNWMLSWIYNFKVGAGLQLVGARGGRPRLDLNMVDGNGVPVSDGDPDVPYDITEGASGGTTTIPGPFEPVYTGGVLSGLKNCIYCAERQFVECSGVDSAGVLAISGVTASTSGYVVLTLTHNVYSGSSYVIYSESVAVEASLPMNSGDGQTDTTGDGQTKIPLYHITDGVVDVDLRAVPTAVLAR